MTHRKTHKHNPGKPRFRGFPISPRLLISLGVVAIAIIVFIIRVNNVSSTPVPAVSADELKAAIIDQLGASQPNRIFNDTARQTLTDYGFKVDTYLGDEVTVDLYRNLPLYGYRLIIFRVHSGLLIGKNSVANQVWLFSSESYSRMKYFFQQLRGQLTNATADPGIPPVFALGAKFIQGGMKGNFTNSAIIMMGCAGYQSEDLAKAFIQNGASVYAAWDASVRLDYVDNATLTLLKELCTNKLTVAKAVEETREKNGPDPDTRASLKCYPAENAAKTLSQLIE